MIRVLGAPRPMVGLDHSTEPKPEVPAVPAYAGLTLADLAPALFVAFSNRLTVKEIQHTVADFYGVRPNVMTDPDSRRGARERRMVRPRQVAMFFSRELTPMSLPEIGRRFGNRDHTTVIHALKAVEQRAMEDPYVELELEVLRERLTA